MTTVKVSKNRSYSDSDVKEKKKLKLEWVRNPAIFAAVLDVFKKKDLVGPRDDESGSEEAFGKEPLPPIRKQKVRVSMLCCYWNCIFFHVIKIVVVKSSFFHDS